MSIPVCIQNNIVIELESKFQDELVADNGLKFYQDTTFRPEWNTTVKGKVVSVPKKLTIGNGQSQTLDPDRVRIQQKIKAGDEIIFSYLVIMNRKMTDNAGEIFTRDTPIDPYNCTWSNPNGLMLVRVYLMNDKFEVGLLDTKSKIWVDRIKGNEKDVENFMAKYMPTENYGFNYGNLLPFEGKDYWLVDYSNAVAIKKGDRFEMIGEYVLVAPIREPYRGAYEGDLEIYNIDQDTDFRATGRVISIGEPLQDGKRLSVKPNDVIVTDIRYVEKYCIDGVDLWVIRQKYIYGKQSVANEHIGDS